MSKPQELSQRDIVKIAAEAGAKAALERINRERNSPERSDRRLRNTKLLLRSYRGLKTHCEAAVYSEEQLDTTELDIMDLMNGTDKGELYIESIKKSATRTSLMIAHIERMLEMYKLYCDRSPKPEDERRYRVIRDMYMLDDPLTTDEIADMECVDRRTIYRDVDDASAVLSVFFFGIDGITT